MAGADDDHCPSVDVGAWVNRLSPPECNCKVCILARSIAGVIDTVGLTANESLQAISRVLAVHYYSAARLYGPAVARQIDSQLDGHAGANIRTLIADFGTSPIRPDAPIDTIGTTKGTA